MKYGVDVFCRLLNERIIGEHLRHLVEHVLFQPKGHRADMKDIYIAISADGD